MGKLLVLGGGVGPAAGVAAQDKIIKMTDNRGNDQGHADLIQTSVSSRVMDRTKWLNRNKSGHGADLKQANVLGNPGTAQANVINNSLAGWLANSKQQAVIGVPCNTFHSKEVWDAFIKGLNKPDQLDVVHMINETADVILKGFPEERENGTLLVGLLSTQGTRDTGVYGNVFKEKGIPLRLLAGDPGDKNYEKTPQGAVMEAIYNSQWGIKGDNPDYKRAYEIIESAIHWLSKPSKDQKGTPVAFILGCTELPLPYKELKQPIPHNYVDPVDVLVRQMIKRGDYQLKKTVPFTELVDQQSKL